VYSFFLSQSLSWAALHEEKGIRSIERNIESQGVSKGRIHVAAKQGKSGDRIWKRVAMCAPPPIQLSATSIYLSQGNALFAVIVKGHVIM
jgi:hypothetical protein